MSKNTLDKHSLLPWIYLTIKKRELNKSARF